MDYINYIKDLDLVLKNSIVFSKTIETIITNVVNSLQNDGTLFFCGNGGSAAESQHLSAEFMGRFVINRKPLKSISLTVDTSNITSIANDYDFNKVYARQLEALGRKGDILFSLSTSGNSENVINAIELAHKIGIETISFLGGSGGKIKDMCDHQILVPSNKTYHIQETHQIIGHFICLNVEEKLFH